MGNAEATQLYQQLKGEWDKGSAADNQAIARLLVQLKIELSSLSLLIPSPQTTTSDQGALTTAREVLEIGALHSIRTDDVAAFERYLALLQTYYGDFGASLPSSSHEAPLTALSLLRLLSQNRIAEFHTLLETLTLDERKKSVVESKEVAWVLQLERSLMEGSYSRVWQLCRTSSPSSTLPLPEFAHFTPSLLTTVRNEIAACDEKAYETLPVRDAKVLLFFEEEEGVKEFAEQRNWHLDPATSLLHFPSSPLHPSRLSAVSHTGAPTSLSTGFNATPAEESRELDRQKVIEATLGYAKELESIV
ncbi:hypothetical protein JCM11251_007784 [Rhodosporidiobolus azoricus]